MTDYRALEKRLKRIEQALEDAPGNARILLIQKENEKDMEKQRVKAEYKEERNVILEFVAPVSCNT